jgi:hypothetical protein
VSLLTPRRLRPLLLAVWFLPNMLTGRLADEAYLWARAEAGRPMLVTSASIALIVGSAVALMLAAAPKGERRQRQP